VIGIQVLLQAAIGIQVLALGEMASPRKMLGQGAMASVLQMAMLLAKVLVLELKVLAATVAKVSRQRQLDE
jgi:hypothetical protein